MTSTVNITGNVHDLIAGDFDARRTKVYLRHNADYVIDDSGIIRLGSASLRIENDGSFTLPDVVAAADTVENLLATVYVDFTDPAARKRETQKFGPYDLSGESGTVDLADLDAVQYFDATRGSELLAEMQALKDAQVAISGINDTDSAVAALIEDAMVGPLTTAALSASYTSVFTPEAYGAVGDGTTNDTSAVQAAINAAAALGGTVKFAAKTYRINGQLTTPNTSRSPVNKQRPIVWEGEGALMDGQWGATPFGGTVLDMRYAGAGPAKIMTKGGGVFEITGITFTSGLAGDDKAFLQTTNTTVKIHHNAFVGDTTVSGQSCVQDAILLGGTDGVVPSGIQTNNDDGPFQGYGTIIADNYFSHIREGVRARTFANSVWIIRNTFSTTCGAADNTHGAIHSIAGTGQANWGVIIRDNLIECPAYPRPILFQNTANSIIDGNSFWDGDGINECAIYFDADSTGNVVIVAFNGTTDGGGGAPAVTEGTPGTNTIIDVGRGSSAIQWSQHINVANGKTLAMKGGEIDFGPASGAADVHLLRRAAGRLDLLEVFWAVGDIQAGASQILTMGTLGTGDGWVSSGSSRLKLRAQGSNGEVWALQPVVLPVFSTTGGYPTASNYTVGAAIYFQNVKKVGYADPGAGKWVDALGTIII